MKAAWLPAVAFLVTLGARPLPRSAARDPFDRLQSLAGEWRGVHKDGRTAQAMFRVVGSGSAVMQELVETEHGERMITMFHRNGPRLQLTHYCTAGNQPRMLATASPDGDTIAFQFRDAANLLPTQEGHMVRLVLRLLASDRHIEEWTFRDQRGVETTDVIDLRRPRP